MADKMVQDKSTPGPVSGELKGALASGGESQGAGYPNANAGKKPKSGGFMGHGGQTEMGYHGKGQLGGQKVGEGNENAPATTEDKQKD